MREISRATRAALAGIAVAAAMFTSMPGVLAYNGSAAAGYADSWWNQRNPNWPNYGSGSGCTDCTNFVSQALNAGGYSMVGVGGSTTSDYNWFAQSQWWGWNTTNSWRLVVNQYNFQNNHYPGGWSNATRAGTDGGATVNTIGDLYFYDFGDGAGLSHMSIEVAYGADATYPTWNGDLVDAHCNDRYHAIWSLAPYNALRSTTTVYLMRIDVNNH